MMAAIVAICGTASMNAQHTTTVDKKLSSDIRSAMVRYQMERKAPGTMRHPTALVETICAFIKFNSGDAESLLAKYGCEKVTQIGDIYIANIPVAQIEAMAGDDQVKRIETKTGGRLLNDITPNWVNNADVYSGSGLPQGYDGSGVLLGIVDAGIDVTHPSFYAEDGETYRIKAFVDDYYSGDVTRGVQTPIGQEFTTEEDILDHQLYTGDTLVSHGTHTLGTAAGSGYGSPFRGIAYGADIFAINTTLARGPIYNSADQTARIKRIFDYADQKGQPCVISYSIGFDSEPYDIQIFTEALQAMLGPGRILVASAGNENSYYTYLHKPAGMKTAGSGLALIRNEPTSFYLMSEQPFRLKCFSCIFDLSGVPGYLLTDSIAFDTEAIPTDSVVMNDHHIIFEKKSDSFYKLSDRFENKNPSTIQSMTFVIEDENADVQAFSTKIGKFTHMGLPLMKDPRFGYAEAGHNIQMPGSLPQAITAGALNGRWSFVNAAGDTLRESKGGNNIGKIANFSSNGPTIDGHIKPDVVAPGVNIISAGNSYCSESFTESMVALTNFKGRDYPWFATSGTSMSAPCVAGIVALWLQADPTLTPDRVKDIIRETSWHPDTSMDYPNNTYGHGLIDAYAGMLKVLGISDAIPSVSTHHPAALRIQPAAHGVHLIFDTPPAKPFTVNVYTVAGQLLTTQHIQPTDGIMTYDIDLPVPQQSVCVVQVSSAERSMTGSELITFH